MMGTVTVTPRPRSPKDEYVLRRRGNNRVKTPTSVRILVLDVKSREGYYDFSNLLNIIYGRVN